MTKIKALARFSLSSRLMIYSVIFTFILLIGFWTILFWLTKENLVQQDQEVLRDRLGTISAILLRDSGPSERLTHRVTVEWLQRDFEHIYVRVLGPQDALVTETPRTETQDPRVMRFLESYTRLDWRRQPLRRFETDGHIYQAATREVAISDGAAPGKYLVEIAVDRTHEQALLSEFRTFFVILLFIAGGASLWLGRTTILIALDPIRDVTAMAARVNSERLNERIDPGSLPVEFREVSETMNAMLNRLSQSFDRLTRFSQDMAHELRTPVNNLLGSMEVGLSRERSIEEYKNLLGSGVEECERLRRIIDSLMFIARTSDPNHKLVKQPLQIDKELSDIVSFYELSAEEKNIQLRLEGDTDRPILAERTHLQRCIGNLLSNSIRHSPENSEIVLRVEDSDPWLIVKVIDFGCGIPKASLQRVGERFFRPDESRSKIYGGTGLGLSIAKSIAEMHGGQMQVQSEENVGTTISLLFPKT